MFTDPNTKEVLDKLFSTNIEKLRRSEFIGIGFDFGAMVDTLSEIISDYKKIDQNQKNLRISVETENSLRSIANNIFNNIIQQITNFNAKDNPNSSNEYQNINNNLKSYYNEFIKSSDLLLQRIDLSSLTPGKVKNEIAQISKLRAETEKLVNDLAAQKKEAETIIRQASGVSAVSSSSNIFSDQSDEHKTTANYWFIASIVVFIILFVSILAIFYGLWPFTNFKIEEITNTYVLIHVLAFKIIILSTAYYLLHQCVKNYKIHRHLYVVNKHRQNALNVYPKMITAGEDVETRNTIVAQASKSIFEQTPSGYLQYDDDPRPINPTEIVNKFIDKTK
jgi:hypothetical protein